MTDEQLHGMHLANEEESRPEAFPYLSTLSSGFVYQFTPVAKAPTKPEILFVPYKKRDAAFTGVMAGWNYLWESAQFRGEVFRKSEMGKRVPPEFKWLHSLPPTNLYLVAETPSKYEAYAPLYHILPKRLVQRHGLPLLRRGLWPVNAASPWLEDVLPVDFRNRLSRAFAEHVFPYLNSGSGASAFHRNEPTVLLSHSLDYWLPAAVKVIERIRGCFSRCEPENKRQSKFLERAQREYDPDVDILRPLKGGTLWEGEEEAEMITSEIVDEADRTGQLRSLLDAVNSNRVVDDFSNRWSYAREDFERKLFRKRSKCRVSFVELKDTLPVHSARSEYTDDLLWQDFSAILDSRERHIVVCLRNGTTNLGAIADSLGYANHSPISKALARIRRKASAFLT